jgi:septum formation protein
MIRRLVLASGSTVRQTLLSNAGVAFDVHPANIDEAEIAAQMLRSKETHAAIAQRLADDKTMAVCRQKPGRIVLGADQILSFGGLFLIKCTYEEEARLRLKMLRSKTHDLFGAMTLARDGEVLWRHGENCRLTMRDFSDDFLERYLANGLPDILSSVGAYFLEGEGLQLFSKIEGDYFSVLGLSMLPLMEVLRAYDLVDR